MREGNWTLVGGVPLFVLVFFLEQVAFFWLCLAVIGIKSDQVGSLLFTLHTRMLWDCLIFFQYIRGMSFIWDILDFSRRESGRGWHWRFPVFHDLSKGITEASDRCLPSSPLCSVLSWFAVGKSICALYLYANFLVASSFFIYHSEIPYIFYRLLIQAWWKVPLRGLSGKLANRSERFRCFRISTLWRLVTYLF